MSIIEELEKIGSFDIALKADAAAYITKEMRVGRTFYDPLPRSKGAATVCVTNQRVNVSDFPSPSDPSTTVHPLLNAARWSGVLRSVSDRGRALSGHGLLGLLNDPDGLGSWTTDFVDEETTGPEAANVITKLITGGTLNVASGGYKTLAQSHLRAGTIGADTTDVDFGGAHRHLDLIREISMRRGRSYYVDPAGRFHWGDKADVFSHNIIWCVVGDLPADSDPRWPSVRAELEDWGETTEGYVSRLHGDGIGSFGASLSADTGPHYWSGLTGRPFQPMDYLAYDPEDEEYTPWKFRADLTVAYWAFNQWSASVSGRLVNGDHLSIIPGHVVYLWDEALGVVDDDNEITFGGHPIRPVKVPIISSSWDPCEGMGVYLLWSDEGDPQEVLDLTDFVDLAPERRVDLQLGRPAPTI